MSTINRITGLSSGIDTEAYIEKLMEAEKIPLTNLEKSETTVEWQREALLEINSKLLSFRNTASDMKLQGTYKSYSAVSSDLNAVTATTTTDAQEGIYKVSVSQLATKTTLSGTSSSDPITSRRILRSESNNINGKEFAITYNGETKVIKFADNEDNYTIAVDGVSGKDRMQADFQNKIDDAFGANQISVTMDGSTLGYNVLFSSVNTLNLPITFSSSTEDASKDMLSDTALGLESGVSTAFNSGESLESALGSGAFDAEGNMELTVNDKSFTFNKSDTVSDVFTTLNRDTDIDITIEYSAIKKSVSISRDTYGAGRQLTIGGNSAFWNRMKINTSGALQDGQNAKFDITSPNGETATDVEMASNTFTYNGVSMTLLKANPGQEVSVTVSKNVDEIYGKIENFINSYNDVLTTLNKYYKEESSGYEPLTKDEKSALSDTQQEQWEKLAKQGILRRDSTLQTAISNMRTAVTSYVKDSDISSLFEIGISTSGYDAVNPQNNGKLEITDKEALKDAIKNDIEGVATLFSNPADLVKGGKLTTETKDMALNGKSFSVTYGGATRTFTFSKDYDLNNSDERAGFEDDVKDMLENAFGTGAISVSVSNDRIVFNSLKSADMTFNSGADDALALFGIKDGAKYDTTQKGFAVKIYDICTTTMGNIVDKAGASSTVVDGSVLGKKLDRIKDDMSSLEDRLAELENRYYDQFAAMEDAMSKMQSQSSYLTSMLNGG